MGSAGCVGGECANQRWLLRVCVWVCVSSMFAVTERRDPGCTWCQSSTPPLQSADEMSDLQRQTSLPAAVTLWFLEHQRGALQSQGCQDTTCLLPYLSLSRSDTVSPTPDRGANPIFPEPSPSNRGHGRATIQPAWSNRCQRASSCHILMDWDPAATCCIITHTSTRSPPTGRRLNCY